jgi:hypothetical protein
MAPQVPKIGAEPWQTSSVYPGQLGSTRTSADRDPALLMVFVCADGSGNTPAWSF